MLTRRAKKRSGCRAEKYAIDANRDIAENLTPQRGAHSDIRHPQVLSTKRKRLLRCRWLTFRAQDNQWRGQPLRSGQV